MCSRDWRSLALGAMVLAPPNLARAQDPHPPVVIVSGLAERQVPADSAEVRVAWYLMNAGSAAQEVEDSVAVDSLQSLLRTAGVATPVIRHASAPWYAPMREDSPDRPRDRRREVSTTIIGEQAIIAAMAALRNHPVFEEAGADYGCTCADSVRLQLLQEAFAISRARASALAAAAGSRLEGVFAMSTEPLDAQMLRGFQSVSLTGNGIESDRLSLMRAPTRPVDGLAAPLVTVVAGVYVVWEVER